MLFEWDQAKNVTNQRKHGLSFDIARMVFSDPLAIIRMDPGPIKKSVGRSSARQTIRLLRLWSISFVMKTPKSIG